MLACHHQGHWEEISVYFQYTGVPKVRPPKEIPLKCRISVGICGTKIITSIQKSFVLYLWKISLIVIRYSLRNHELLKRWLLRSVRVRRTWGSAPLFHCFGRIEHWQINHDSDDLTHIFRPSKFMVYQTKFYKYIMRSSVWNSNKIATFLFA